ncbi:MAG: Uncharacterized protein Athens071416_326 [Parcubacteria group bacterium Athens0714_16]|nr:MAG: Uncharacterized protein Athens071416_326 [Parcubacteria group bacterium Athens0714_16]
MYIINVIPISKSIQKETLSYFSKKKILAGSVIKISLRNKIVLGIVVSTKDIREMKTSIKTADFKMKKITDDSSFEIFTQEFISATQKISDYYASSSGVILNSLMPAVILQNPKEVSIKIKFKCSGGAFKSIINKKIADISAIQDTNTERVSRYKNIVREEFAKGHSVFMCAPTINDIEYLLNSVEKGLEEYTFVLHSYLSKKILLSTWNDICNKKHPVVIIGTGKFLSVPRNDIKTIIIEKENSYSYKMDTRPFLDIRKFAEVFAKEIDAKIILGDDVLRTETLWRYKEGKISEEGHVKIRYDNRARVVIENLSQKKDLNAQVKQAEENKFKIFGEELDKIIKGLSEKKEKLFLFTVRKGLHPIVLCSDCGAIVRCENCNSPVILYSQGEKRFLSCNLCNKKREVDKKCRTCNSWRLDAFGIGIDLIEKKIKEEYKNIPIFKIDSDSVKTHKKALLVVKSFNESEYGILLSTEMGLNYIKKDIENSVIISMDSLFSIPNFYMSEKIFSIITQIKLFTQNNLIIQTRNSDENLIKLASEGNVGEFYRNEIENRKKFAYPPFSKFIKISVSEKREFIQKYIDIIKTELKEYNISVYPSYRSRIKNNQVMNFLISIPEEKWVDNNLLQKLRFLPQKFSIEVDPENLL